MVGRRRLRAALAAGLILLAAAPAAGSETPDPALRAALADAIAEGDAFADRFVAEVWLTDFGARIARYVPDPEQRYALLRSVHREAARAELPPELVLAVIEVESHFDRYAISSAGALGLMQIMPFWLNELGRPEDNLFDPDTNLRYGCTILAHYLARENGDLMRALGRYNGRINKNPYAGKVIEALHRRWFRQ